MDFIDILRTVVRRWYITLLVAAVGIALTVYVASSIEPVYSVEAQSLVVGPAKETDPGTGLEQPVDMAVNPYMRFSGSLDVTAQAIIRVVDGSEFRSVLDEEGLEGDFEFEAPPGAALILITTEAATPGESSALATRISEGLATTLAGIQSEVSVPPDEQITLRTLTVSDPEELSGSRQRVLIGGVGLSLALGAVAAVTVDTVMSRRRRQVEPPATTADDQGGAGDQRTDVDQRTTHDRSAADEQRTDEPVERSEDLGTPSSVGPFG